MRKIVSRHQRKRTRRRNQFIVGFILVFLMVSSTLGFAFQGHLSNRSPTQDNTNQNMVHYNGFSFENFNGFWVWGNFAFRNLPGDVPEIGGELKNLDHYRGEPVYIRSENEDARSEIIVNLGQVAGGVQGACLQKKDCGENEFVRTCEDNFIIIEENSKTEIVQNNNCVFIHGSADNLIKLTDQFLFKIMGIK